MQIHDARGGAVYYGSLSSSYLGARKCHFPAEVLSKCSGSRAQTGALRLDYQHSTFAGHHGQPWPEGSVGLGQMKMSPDSLFRDQGQSPFGLPWQSTYCIYSMVVEAYLRAYP